MFLLHHVSLYLNLHLWIERNETNSEIIDLNLRVQSKVEIDASIHFLNNVNWQYWKHYLYNPVVCHEPYYFITNVVASLQDKIANNIKRNKVPSIVREIDR